MPSRSQTNAPGKPRHHICWYCLQKLRGNHHVVKVVDHHERILHKACAKRVAVDPAYWEHEVDAMEKPFGQDTKYAE